MSSFVARLLTAAGRSALVANAWMSLSTSLSSSIRRIVAQTSGALPARSALEGSAVEGGEVAGRPAFIRAARASKR